MLDTDAQVEHVVYQPCVPGARHNAASQHSSKATAFYTRDLKVQVQNPAMQEFKGRRKSKAVQVIPVPSEPNTVIQLKYSNTVKYSTGTIVGMSQTLC